MWGEGGFLRRRRGRDGWEKDMNTFLYSSVNRYHTNKCELIHVHVHDTLDGTRYEQSMRYIVHTCTCIMYHV